MYNALLLNFRSFQSCSVRAEEVKQLSNRAVLAVHLSTDKTPIAGRSNRERENEPQRFAETA